MKLQHLAIGARFEYEGKVFVKTGPLTATSDQGGQQLIPRYAMLKPLDLPDTSESAGKQLDPQKVRKAFAAFYSECLRHCPQTSHAELEAARTAFLAVLK